MTDTTRIKISTVIFEPNGLVYQEISLFSRDTQNHVAVMFREAWAVADGIKIEENE